MDRGLIDDEGKKAGQSIQQAGNDAVHDLAKFKNPSRYDLKYSTNTTELVDGLRKIIEDLHSPETP